MKKLCLLLGVVGMSLSAIFVRLASAPSMVLVFYRVALSALLLLPLVLLRHRAELSGLTGRDIGLCILSGAFLGLHFTLYFESLRYTSVAAAVALVDTEVFFVALAMLLLFRETISRGGWLGIGATFAGSLLIAMADAGGGSDLLRGDLLALGGAATMAVYTMIGKVCRKRISTTVYTLFVYTAAAVTVLVLLLAGGTPVFGYAPKNLWAAAGLAVFCTLLGHSVFSWGLKFESASFIATIKLLEPVFSSVFAFFLFGEVPAWLTVLGGGIVILGVYLYARLGEARDAQRERTVEADE